jgi:hypothetical protein
MSDIDLNEPIATTLARLETMTVNELRAFHLKHLGTSTNSRHRLWLIRRIAWRLQAKAEGGLSERALKRAAELAEGQQLRVRRPSDKQLPAMPRATKIVSLPATTAVALSPGTALERVWKGEAHRVLVHPEGFEYQGQFYKSLSAVAKSITGTKWNGHVFFGLKKQKRSKQEVAA